jgi:hypothetical protein
MLPESRLAVAEWSRRWNIEEPDIVDWLVTHCCEDLVSHVTRRQGVEQEDTEDKVIQFPVDRARRKTLKTSRHDATARAMPRDLPEE